MKHLRTLCCFLLAFITVLFVACAKVKCHNEYRSPALAFEGFDSTSLNIVIVTQYSTNGNFSNVIKRDTFRLSDNAYALRVYDTAHGYVDWPFSTKLLEGSDWQIDVVALNKRYRISGFEFTDEYSKYPHSSADGDVCYNACTGYYLNGVYTSTGQTNATYGRLDNSTVYIVR